MSVPYAVVLGASTGVGAEIAVELATRGYKVIGFHRGRHQKEAAAVLARMQNATAYTAEFFALDAGSSPEAVIRCVRELTSLVQTDRRIHVFVHSLSGAATGRVLPRAPEKLAQTFNHLAHSFLWWAQELHAQQLFTPHAKLIALSNPCPDFYLGNSGVIGAAKAALEVYVKLLAAEMGPHGQRVNCVRFSTVLTPALCKVLPPEAIAKLSAIHRTLVPAGRMQTAADVAQFVGLMVSGQCEWMNGAVVDLTGAAPYMLMDQVFNR